MTNKKTAQFYDLSIEMKGRDINKNDVVSIENHKVVSNQLSFKVQEIKPYKTSILSLFLKDIKRLFQAVFIPIKNNLSRAKLFNLSVIYALLVPSGISIFFIRGWRFEIVKRMIKAEENKAIAPSMNSLDVLGGFIRDGALLFGVKLLYDIPKILILVALGYDHLELIIHWIYTYVSAAFGFGMPENFARDAFVDFRFTIFLQITIYLIMSFIITPAFKISMMKYANGAMDFKGFFRLKEIKHSFCIYRKYKTSTITTYIWDGIVTISTNFLGIGFALFLVPIAPLLIIFIPLYKVLFKHWPKAYGYGKLAQRLVANGEI